jgi:hypothetical protein
MLLLKFLKIWLLSQQDGDLAVLFPPPGKQYHHVLLLNTSVEFIRVCLWKHFTFFQFEIRGK